MVVEEMDELLKPYGCEVVCESPFEIASDCGEFIATGFFAHWIIEYLEGQEDQEDEKGL